MSYTDPAEGFFNAFSQGVFPVFGLERKAENGSDGRLLYEGYCLPGSTVSQSRWVIRKFDSVAGWRWARAAAAAEKFQFNKVWNDRASYNYVDL